METLTTYTNDVTGDLVPVRAKARKADRFSYGWNGYEFYVDFRTEETFAIAR